jgi:4-hydroxybutyrate CoA-transferase
MKTDFTVDWRSYYEGHLRSPEEAAATVQNGDHIWVPTAHGSPAIMEALAARSGQVEDVQIRGLGVPAPSLFTPEAATSFHYQDQFANVFSRQGLDSRVIDHHPFWLVGGHKALDAGRDDAWAIDKVQITVSPPNDQGFVSVGPNVWDSVPTARRAKSVIASVNPAIGPTFGDTWLHVTEIECFVPEERPAPGLPPPDDPADEGMAHYVGTLVKDGDTVQIGTGSHTSGMVEFGLFKDRQELSYFGELTVAGLVPLVQGGVFTGRTSALHPGRFVATLIGNNPEERAQVFGNPAFEAYSTEYLLNPRNIARNESIVAINGALGIDLTGQVAVYALGPRLYAGMGGHLAFAIGAFLAPKGRYVCVMPSTAAGGTVSTITPQFGVGQVVSVPREITDTVVTEFGVARLLGKSVRQRADELISIAHPDFRGELRKAAQRLFYP